MNRQKPVEDVVTFNSPSGDEMVVVPAARYRKLIEAAAMNEDIAVYEAAKERLARGDDELVPVAHVDRLLAGENPVTVWREYRGLTVKAFAAAAGISQAYLSQIESGRRDGTIGTMKKIAEALNVDLDDLV